MEQFLEDDSESVGSTRTSRLDIRMTKDVLSWQKGVEKSKGRWRLPTIFELIYILKHSPDYTRAGVAYMSLTLDTDSLNNAGVRVQKTFAQNARAWTTGVTPDGDVPSISSYPIGRALYSIMYVRDVAGRNRAAPSVEGKPATYKEVKQYLDSGVLPKWHDKISIGHIEPVKERVRRTRTKTVKTVKTVKSVKRRR